MPQVTKKRASSGTVRSILDSSHWGDDNGPYLPAILRVVLGLVLVIGGVKLAFHPHPEALAATYVDPASGWIAPYFAEQITDRLGVEVSSFLRVQGLLEIAVGLLLIVGLFTQAAAIVAGLMFWSFTVANPAIGAIRLSRDISLAALCFGLAAAGPGKASLDQAFRRVSTAWDGRRDVLLLVIRLSLAFTLIASALFRGGVYNNHLNTTLPVVIVGLLAVTLVAGIAPRWATGAVLVWMIYLVGFNLLSQGLLLGLDSVKREVAFLVASFIYVAAGPDRWAWFRHV